MMTQEQKTLIAEGVKTLCRKESQGKIATKAEVSTATISQIVNGNWGQITAELWRKVKLNLRISWGWQTAKTQNLKKTSTLLESAQTRSMSLAIAHNAGAGKSYGYQHYQAHHDNVIYIECKRYWTTKSYVKHLLKACGLEQQGTIEEMIELFIDHLKKMSHPLVIIDQCDKLKQGAFDLFVDLYNEVDGSCGFVLSGVPALKKMVMLGCKADRKGYKEFFSRIGRKYLSLATISEVDVDAVCRANGVTDANFINQAYNTCEGDFRRVRKDVDKYMLQQAEAIKTA